jgi:hypothetical protein
MRDSKLTRSWAESSGFRVLSAREFLRAPEQVRDTMGVYMILLSRAGEILSRAGLRDIAGLAAWTVSGHQHVYTGESIGVRSRVLTHLVGTVRDSAVREILLALQFSNAALWSYENENLEDLEAKLTDWLSVNAMVAFRACNYVRDVERDLISRMPSPFNTKDNRKNTLAPHFKALRLGLRSHLQATGQFRHRERRPRAGWLIGRTRDHLAGEPSHVT